MFLGSPLWRASKNQADHNIALVDEPIFPHLDPNSPYRDWATTICFYAALHYFMAYCQQNPAMPKRFKDHKTRNRFIKTNTDLKIQSIRQDYITLFKASEDARYKPLYFNRQLPNDVEQYYKLAVEEIPRKLGIK
jgi:hypothetical protein